MMLVTGATGNNGLEILKRLAMQNLPVRAMVRNSHSERLRQRDRATTISTLPHVEIAEARQLAFVNAAKQSGVKHIVKLSQYAANADSPVRFLRYHAAVEAAIQASGLNYTFLRPNLFMQGLLNFRSTIATQNA